VNSCTIPNNDLVRPAATDNALFNRYVAIGNSITAGYQSGGITDSTQRRSYAFLLAQAMGTRFAYPSMTNPGCPPLVSNFQTQTRVGGATGATCFLRSAASAADLMNNVAVPGAWSSDPNDADGSAFSNALTTFFLGGRSQVQRARDARPTFVSIWIGNNDVLGPASTGCTTANAACPLTLGAITSSAAFSATYDALVDSLLVGNGDLEGVLIGVVNVTNAPLYFAVTALTGATKAAFDAIACGPGTASTTCAGGATTIDATCTGAPGNGSLINTMLAFQIRLNAHPAFIVCTPGGPGGVTYPAPVGDVLVLDSGEQATITAAVNGYNTYLATKASDLGWAFYDPNGQLQTLKAANTVVRSVPTFGATGTFGTGMSLDGVHPGAAVHLLIANDLVAAINAQYFTSLATIF